jgi:hypothetical protein
LKKYESFLREPIQWGEPSLRSGAVEWHRKELEMIDAVRNALKSGLTIEATERLVSCLQTPEFTYQVLIFIYVFVGL